MTNIISPPFIPTLARDKEHMLQQTFPAYHAKQNANSQPEVLSFSWPLPGANAVKNKASIPAKVKAAASSTSKKEASRKVQSTQLRGIRRKNTSSHFDGNRVRRKGISASGGAAQGTNHAGDGSAKESMMSSGTYSSYLGKKNLMAGVDRHESIIKNNTMKINHATGLKREYQSTEAIRRREKGIFHQPQTLVVKDDSVNRTIYNSVQDKDIHCLHFIDVQESETYIKQMRFNKRNNFFCLDITLWSFFDTLFHKPRYSDNGFKPEQIISHVIKHTTSDITRIVNVKEHQNLASAWLGPGEFRSRLTGSLTSVLTLSLVEDADLRQKGIEDKFVLPENTFKLFKAPGPLGSDGYFLGYHVNRCREHQGFNAGILPLRIENDLIFFEDDTTGIAFKGESINTFIEGVKKISGLAYHYTTPLRRSQSDSTMREHELLKTQSLFINKNATQSAFCLGMSNNLNETLSILSPVIVNHSHSDRQYMLYRTCFTLVGNSLLYVNQQGEQGEFRLENTTQKSQRYHVQPQSASDARFYNLFGFIHQQPYSKEALITQLEQKGFHYLVMENATNTELLIRSDGFYVDYNEGMPDEIEENTTSSPTAVEKETEVSKGFYNCFFLDENELHYYDQKGRYGILSFTPSDRLPLMILDENKMLPEHVIFSSSIPLVPNLAYNKTEIHTRLYKKGYVNFPNMPAPSST